MTPSDFLGLARKWLESDSKVTQMTLKWLKNDSSSHFWVTFESLSGQAQKVTLESLLSHFNCFGVWGSLAGNADHNPGVLPSVQFQRHALAGSKKALLQNRREMIRDVCRGKCSCLFEFCLSGCFCWIAELLLNCCCCCCCCWFRNFQCNDSDSDLKVRVTGQKSEVTDQKSELQPGRPPESEPNRLEKTPEWGLAASTENPL